MKKQILAVSVLLFMAGFANAIGSVWTSSHTATADTTKSLCGTNKKTRGLLHTVCVNDGAGGTITVYDSVITAANIVAVIRSTGAVNAGCLLYDVAMSSGIAYTTSSANDVTFSYSCY